MKRLIAVACVVLSACSSTPATTTVTTRPVPEASGPEEILEAFLAALQTADYGATAPYVDETQVALLAGIEDADATSYLALHDDGLTEPVRTNFWSSFAGAIPGLEGSGPVDLLVTSAGQFDVAGTRFARVDLRFRGSVASGQWVLRQTDDTWVVDPIATFGGAFVSPVRLWMRGVADADVPKVRARVAANRTSWEALGIQQDPNDEAGVAVLAELSGLLAELPLP